MGITVAIIGAGSVGFTRGLVRDLLSVAALADEVTLSLTDINPTALDYASKILRHDIAGAGVGARVQTSKDRRRALAGADYVINLTRIGGYEAFELDVEIPLRYGVDQCVGDTLCAGGILYGQRNIPQILAFCKDIREVAAPDALFLNYANPNAMNTWAAIHHGGVRTVGLCHGVQHTHAMIARVIERMVNKGRKPESRGYRPVPRQEVHILCAGINHQTWYLQVRYDGQDWTDRLLAGFEAHPEYSKTEKVRIDMLRRFGYFSTESNGHLSEYVPWYRKNRREAKRWSDPSCWIHGRTGGYLEFCRKARRNWSPATFKAMLAEPPLPYGAEHRSVEHGSYIIEALEGARPGGDAYRGHFNVVNHKAIDNLPADAIVEVPGYIDPNGISIPRVGPLPLGCAAVCNASISVQRLAVAAAVTGDVTLLKQAMLMDPLTGAVLTPPAIDRMTDEMLIAQAKWLPQYKRAIAVARKRLAASPKRAAAKR